MESLVTLSYKTKELQIFEIDWNVRLPFMASLVTLSYKTKELQFFEIDCKCTAASLEGKLCYSP
jgi:hypothetical protein